MIAGARYLRSKCWVLQRGIVIVNGLFRTGTIFMTYSVSRSGGSCIERRSLTYFCFDRMAFQCCTSGPEGVFLQVPDTNRRKIFTLWRKTAEKFDCRKFPNSLNIKTVLTEVAHKELIQKPRYITDSWVPIIRKGLADTKHGTIEGLTAEFELKQSSTSKKSHCLFTQWNNDFSRAANIC